MAIVVKDVNKEVYARFKAKAALLGLNIGPALTIALNEWINKDNELNNIESKNQKNLVFYRQIIHDLCKTNSNKWCVISDGDSKGIYDTEEEALLIASELNGPNLVFQIKEPELIVRHLGLSQVPRRKRFN